MQLLVGFFFLMAQNGYLQFLYDFSKTVKHVYNFVFHAALHGQDCTRIKLKTSLGVQF